MGLLIGSPAPPSLDGRSMRHHDTALCKQADTNVAAARAAILVPPATESFQRPRQGSVRVGRSSESQEHDVCFAPPSCLNRNCDVGALMADSPRYEARLEAAWRDLIASAGALCADLKIAPPAPAARRSSPWPAPYGSHPD
jgi:hypothetical protein